MPIIKLKETLYKNPSEKCFSFQIVGALAEEGGSLAEALETCKRVSEATGTIGVAASGCTLPGASAPLFTVAPGQLELGLGVHGEAGAATIPVSNAWNKPDGNRRKC